MPVWIILLPAAALLAACGDRFSPDVYATRAVQQADKVEQGIIVGVREVRVSAEGSTGAATGAAAGGVLGAQAPGGGILSALGGVGGALVGGLIGKGAEHTIVDTIAYEYIVRTTKNELMRVTQRDRQPLRRGQAVLLITGAQARIVPDYTAVDPATAATQGAAPATPTAAGASAPPPGTAAPGPARAAAQDLPPPAASRPDAPADAVAQPLPPLPAYPPVVPLPRVDSPMTGG
jgi:outer membrane lipoprotein SlyB